MNNTTLERLETVKILRAYLDEGLNWKFHIDYISRRMANFPPTPVLFRTNRCLDTSSKKTIYSSLIYPNLTYCTTVWGNRALTALKPLINFHKQNICSISSAAFRELTQLIMFSLRLLNLNQICTYISYNYVFKG